MAELYTAGSYNLEKHVGGWSVLLVDNDTRTVLSGMEPEVGADRMELIAAVSGIESLPSGSHITITSDSQYLVYTMTQGWRRWQDIDRWDYLDTLCRDRVVDWVWRQGPTAPPENEFVWAQAEWESGFRTRAPLVAEFFGKKTPVFVKEGNVSLEKEPNVGSEGIDFHDNQKEHEQLNVDAELTHLDAKGHAQMVNVGEKAVTKREAIAKGSVVMKPETLALIAGGEIEKGDALAIARVAGIMAAKQTPSLIPLCHPIPLTHVAVEMELDREQSKVHITAKAHATAQTGVEMEAMTAVGIAALTIYDMCKSVDKGIRIEAVRLARKSGGKSGEVVLE